MQLTIQRKLFLIIILPLVTLIVLTFVVAFNDYKIYKSNADALSHMSNINNAAQLLYELEYERGLSSIDAKKDQDNFFKNELKKYRSYVDKKSEIFLKNEKNHKLGLSQEFFKSSKKQILHVPTLRKQIDNKVVSVEDSFIVYSNFIGTLLELMYTVPLFSDDEKVFSYINALQKISQLQELSAYQRGKVTQLLSKDNITERDRFAIRVNAKAQKRESKYIKIILEKTKYKKKLQAIEKQYVSLNLHYLLLTPKQWFIKSSQKIDAIHFLYEDVFHDIISLLSERESDLKNRLIFEIVGTFFVIFFLLIANLYVSRRITHSIEKLRNGLDEFFEYLHFQRELPQKIEIDSRDEIFVMADNINKQMLILDDDLNDDMDFINEVTQIAHMMKEGDFSEHSYSEPKNPNLIELKKVFNELVDLITDKIKKQTVSLERLNSSLEDQVYEQTIELHNQVETVTKARDEAIQAQVIKDEFLANMSHEIRTPLNGILGFVAILKKQLKDAKHLEYVRVIDESGKSLLTIINDILDFSKIQSGKFTIDKHPTAVVEILSDTIMLFASKTNEKDLLYATFIDPNLPKSLSIDSTRVKQILANLLSNAIKFTQNYGEVKVSIVYKNSHLIVSVRDSGIGISEKNQVKIFSAFTQADGSTTRNYGGTGLGLSISSNLAALMGGTLTLQSEIGKGSTFTLSIPADIIEKEPLELLNKIYLKSVKFAILKDCVTCESRLKLIVNYLKAFGVENIVELEHYTDKGYDILFFAPDEEYNIEIIEAEIPAIALLKTEHIKLAKIEHIYGLYTPFIPKNIVNIIEETGVKKLQETIKEEIPEDEEIEYSGSILIAEDNKTNQMLIKLLMMDYGIDLTLANDGVEAVNMFKEGQFDMVLMDENMPNMNGLEAMNQIKLYEKENNLKMTPIIALTASALDTDKEMFINAGMDGFIAKPIEQKMLEAELDKYLKRV